VASAQPQREVPSTTIVDLVLSPELTPAVGSEVGPSSSGAEADSLNYYI
jgi:hypothetical protein